MITVDVESYFRMMGGLSGEYSSNEISAFWHAGLITQEQRDRLLQEHDVDDEDMIDSILRNLYGVNLLDADSITVLWAAEMIENTVRAKQELYIANAIRKRYGLAPAVPEYGSRLF